MVDVKLNTIQFGLAKQVGNRYESRIDDKKDVLHPCSR